MANTEFKLLYSTTNRHMASIAAKLLTSLVLNLIALAVAPNTKSVISPLHSPTDTSLSSLLNILTATDTFLGHEPLKADFSDAFSLVYQLSGSTSHISVSSNCSKRSAILCSLVTQSNQFILVCMRLIMRTS